MSPFQSEELMNMFLDISPSVKGKLILDLGCGDGNASVEFMKRGAKKIVAVDRNPKKGQLAVQNRIVFATTVPSNVTFDLIWCHHMLEHIQDPIKMLNEMWWMGKELWLAVPSMFDGYVLGHINNYTMPLLCEHLKRSGWDVANGLFKKVRGNLWVRVKRFDIGTNKQSDYPYPMKRVIDDFGRCMSVDFQDYNWK